MPEPLCFFRETSSKNGQKTIVEKRCFGMNRKVIEGGVAKVFLMKIGVFLLNLYQKRLNWLSDVQIGVLFCC